MPNLVGSHCNNQVLVCFLLLAIGSDHPKLAFTESGSVIMSTDTLESVDQEVNPGLGPDEGVVAIALEADRSIRESFRLHDRCTNWPDEKTVGIQSVKAMRLNARALEILAEHWCQKTPYAKTIPIDFMRREASKFASKSSEVLLGTEKLLLDTGGARIVNHTHRWCRKGCIPIS